MIDVTGIGPCVSGVANCPCCGHAVMVADWRIPELCAECAVYECDILSPCNVPGEYPEYDENGDPWPYADDPRDN